MKYLFYPLQWHFNRLEMVDCRKKIWFKSIMSLIGIILFATVSYAQIIVVVNYENPIEDISLLELKQMYLGEIISFSNGERVVLAEHADLKEMFCETILDLSLLQFKKHWMRLIFSGNNSTAPTAFENLKKLKNYIIDNKGAIAFVNLTDVDKHLKILTINGNKVGSDAYPFK